MIAALGRREKVVIFLPAVLALFAGVAPISVRVDRKPGSALAIFSPMCASFSALPTMMASTRQHEG
ncbi:hypothetical protein MMEU_3046 [Mycobacterium marinum str. Europe]|nr:hypothetical protein MMEU_3046 [Mycobacterium marinum str. Europe]